MPPPLKVFLKDSENQLDDGDFKKHMTARKRQKTEAVAAELEVSKAYEADSLFEKCHVP